MQLHLDETQLAVQEAVRSFCTDRFALDGVAGREGKAADPAAWKGLADLGVLGMLAGTVEDVGIVEAAIAFEELGAHLASGPVVWTAIAAPLVDGAAEGEVRVTGLTVDEHRGDLPLVVEHADEAQQVLVVHADRVEAVPAGELVVAPGAPLDPLTPVSVLERVPQGREVGDAAAAAQLRLQGTVLHAAALVGVARGALDVARNYALERVQFGVPIGSFQAIKHMLADMYVRVEMARAETYAAAALVKNPAAGDPQRSASAAKLLAGEAGLANARASVQILGGMGFTWDMLPHYFLKRAWVLEQGFGAGSTHATRLAAAVGAEVEV